VTYGDPGSRHVLRAPYLVRIREGDERTGVCFAWTFWGAGRIRWYWVELPSGKRRAFSLSQVRAVFHASTCRCRACATRLAMTPPTRSAILVGDRRPEEGGREEDL
jgi:hypothetical protein